VRLYRRHAARNPAAFGPDLARSPGISGIVLGGLEHPEDASKALEEALRTPLPRLRKLPQAHAELMRAIIRTCLRRCEALGRHPDAELLGPLAGILEHREAGDRGPDGRAAAGFSLPLRAAGASARGRPCPSTLAPRRRRKLRICPLRRARPGPGAGVMPSRGPFSIFREYQAEGVKIS